MSWAYEFSRDAEHDLQSLPKAIQKRLARVLAHMEHDPFAGDVKALQGEIWKGVFRRRLGDYRLLFTADHERNVISIVRILLRTGKTYR